MKYLNDVKAKDIKNSIGTGTAYQSKNSGCFTITSYLDSYNIGIKFINTGYEMVARLECVKDGEVKDRLSPSVYNVGIIGAKYKTKVGGVDLREYTLWRNMLNRCYNKEYHKKHPTYTDCKVSKNFLRYDYFYEWCQKQIGFNCTDDNNRVFYLDKDLLYGEKIYSEYSCVFLPDEINATLRKMDSKRGKYPIGVSFRNDFNNFQAQISINGKCNHLGFFDTELEAFKAYKKAKEAFIKEQANKWKDKIDPRAYEALMKYQVEIDD